MFMDLIPLSVEAKSSLVNIGLQYRLLHFSASIVPELFSDFHPILDFALLQTLRYGIYLKRQEPR